MPLYHLSKLKDMISKNSTLFNAPDHLLKFKSYKSKSRLLDKEFQC